MSQLHSYRPAIAGAILLALIVICCGDLRAQVSVTPTRVIVAAPQRSGEVLVVNPLDQPIVVSTRVMFMVLRNDSTGGIAYDTVYRDDARSCVSWLSVFPRQFTMEPGSKRKIRIMIAVPDTIADGEYMARLEVAGLPVDRPATASGDTTSVRPKVSVRLALNVPVVFRKGNLVTGIELGVTGARRADSMLLVSLGLKPTGNSIYRGTLFSTIQSSAGIEVARTETQFVAEVPYTYPLSFPKLSPGEYTLTIESRTVRQGAAAEAVIPAPPVRQEFRLTIAGTEVEVAALH